MQTWIQQKDIWLWIDPTRYCNLSCALCYTRPSHDRQFLSFDNLQIFIDKIINSGLTIKEITLNWRGEPLTNRNFPKILKLVTSSFPDVRVQFHTNAMLLEERVCDELCSIVAPYYVFLSIDGGTRSSHERNRGLDTFDRALRGGHNLIHRRGSTPWPFITLYQLDMRVDERDYDDEFIALAERCDRWQRVDPIIEDGSSIPVPMSATTPEGYNPQDLWIRNAPTNKPPNGPCFWAGNSLCISPDGTVSVCILSQHFDKSALLGNLHSDSVNTIVIRASEIRNKLNSEGRSSIKHCINCKKIEGDAREPTPLLDLRRNHAQRALRLYTEGER